MILTLLLACGLGDSLLYGPGHPVTSPTDAIVDVSMPILQSLDAEAGPKLSWLWPPTRTGICGK